MIIQDRDGSIVQEPERTTNPTAARPSLWRWVTMFALRRKDHDARLTNEANCFSECSCTPCAMDLS